MSKKKDKKAAKVFDDLRNDPRRVPLIAGGMSFGKGFGSDLSTLHTSDSSSIAFACMSDGRVYAIGFDADVGGHADILEGGFDGSVVHAWCAAANVRRKDVGHYVKAIDSMNSITEARKLLEDAGYAIAEPM